MPGGGLTKLMTEATDDRPVFAEVSSKPSNDEAQKLKCAER
jgi:hypothetical protein